MQLKFFGLVTTLLCTLSALGQIPSMPEMDKNAQSDLVYVVYVSRHGVRSPTGKSSQYDRFSKASWPAWNVEPGLLTPHGFELMKLFGAYDRERLAAAGLLQANGCSDAKYVTIDADSDQRTRETGRALSEGIFPGCKVPVHALEEGTNDPLFHLAPGSITPAQAELGAAAILGRIGNDPNAVATAYHAPLSALDNLLDTCGDAAPGHTRSSIFSVVAGISPGSGDHVAEMKGPLNTAATLTENLLLEYTEGLDAKDVGWGCVDGARLRTLIDLHTASSDIALRTSAVAVPQSAALLRTVARSLEQAQIRKAISGARGNPGDKALFLVGHDTNLSNIAGALGLNWLLDGRRDDTPPGSALIFELWHNRKLNRYEVRVSFTAQTLEQMRQATPLTLTTPPAAVPVFIPGCSHVDDACDATSFRELLERTASSSHSAKIPAP